MTSVLPSASAEWRSHWPTVLASTIGISLAGIYVYSAGALVVPIERETGWSRTAIGSGLSIATAMATLLGPFMGAAVDRFGPRRLALPGVIAFCAAVAALSLTGPTLFHWWSMWLIVGLAGFGIKPALWTAAVAAEFNRGRGLALAVTLSGTSIGAAVVPLLTTVLVGSVGWRLTYVTLAAIWALACFPLAFLCLKDGAARQRAPLASAATDGSMPLRKAMLSSQFFLLLVAISTFTLGAMAFVFSAVPILVSHGLSARTAAGIAALVGITSVIGRITTGLLLDRGDARLVSACALSMPVATALILLAAPGSILAAMIAMAIMGLAFGAELDAIAYLTSRLFGMRHFGALFGTLLSGSAAATSLAPILAGGTYDATGSYDLLLIAMMPLCLTGAVAIASIRSRRPRAEEEASA